MENSIIRRGPRITCTKEVNEIREYTDSDAIAMGDRIRERREAFGHTQLELAEIIGVSERTMCSIESGTANPKLEIIRRLSNYFDTSIDYIVDGRIEQADEEAMKTIMETIKPHEIPYMIGILQLVRQWADAK